MIREYIERALRRAIYEKLDDLTFVAEVPELPGVLANSPALDACRDQLAEVVEEWVLVRIAMGLSVPEIDGVTVEVSCRD